MDLAARLSTGTPWPGQPPQTPARQPANALLLNHEDNHETTTLPRLIKAGADTSRIFLPNSDYFRGPCLLPRHFEALYFHILRIDAKLVILDPLLAFLEPSACSTPARAYSLAQGLQYLAGSTQCAIIVVMHLTKTRFRTAIHRIPGGIALAAVSRSIFMAIADPREENPDPLQHLLVPVKNNLVPRPPTLAYRLADNQLHWQPNPVLGTHPDQLLAIPPAPTTHDQSRLEACAAWLLQQLSTGPQSRVSLLGRAISAGFSQRTLGRAKTLLRIKSDIYPDRGAIWCLPPVHPRTHHAATTTTTPPAVVKTLAIVAIVANLANLPQKPNKNAILQPWPTWPTSHLLGQLPRRRGDRGGGAAAMGENGSPALFVKAHNFDPPPLRHRVR